MQASIIGVLSPLLAGVYFGNLLYGINAVARRRGARVLAVQTLGEDFGLQQPRLVQPLAWQHVDAWVAIVDAVPSDYLQRIKSSGKPIVTLSTFLPEIGCPAILPDNRGGMASIVRHMLDHGHECIAFVGNMQQDDIRERYEGYRQALSERGLAAPPELLFDAVDNMREGGRLVGERLAAQGLPCRAVVAATDHNAIGIMGALMAAGLRVPHDVAVTGFDDMELARYIRPPLTTVRQGFDQLGAAAAELAFAMLDGATVPAAPRYIETSLITRRSCGCKADQLLPVAPVDPGSARWREELSDRLVDLALHPLSRQPGTSATQVWPGVDAIVDALDQTIRTARPPQVELTDAWDGAVRLFSDPNAPQLLIKLLEKSARARLGRRLAASPRVLRALRRFTELAHADLSLAWQMAERDERLYMDMIMRHTYRVTLDLLLPSARNAHDLSWLRVTPMEWGCLGLWTSERKQELSVAGNYARHGAETPALGVRLSTEQFPPPHALAALESSAETSVGFLLPIKTAKRDWGVLALVGPIENRIGSGLGATGQWAALLSVSVERESLLREQAAQQETLRQAYERAQALANTVRELGSPVIPLLPGVLLVPLVGAIEAERAQHFIESVLTGISANNARVVLLDITGVPLVDTQVANSLIHATRAATLLGARIIMVGVRPEIAQTIVGLGIDLEHIATQPTLATALDTLMRQREL